MSNTRILVSAEDVNDHIGILVVNCVEDFFSEGPMSEDEFIDRLCLSYLNVEDWDIEQLDTPAVRKIMRIARRTRREIT